MAKVIKICKFQGCERKHNSKGYCQKHYLQNKKGVLGKIREKERHGMTNTPEFEAWSSILKRCYNEKHKSYCNYGGRGIKICDNWRYSFLTFYADMGSRPSNKYSLDRIDNDKGYSKENCRWATSSQQQINRRIPKNNTSGHKGVQLCKVTGKWKAVIDFKGKKKHLGTFLKKEDAIKARRKAEKRYYNKLV